MQLMCVSIYCARIRTSLQWLNFFQWPSNNNDAFKKHLRIIFVPNWSFLCASLNIYHNVHIPLTLVSIPEEELLLKYHASHQVSYHLQQH